MVKYDFPSEGARVFYLIYGGDPNPVGGGELKKVPGDSKPRQSPSQQDEDDSSAVAPRPDNLFSQQLPGSVFNLANFGVVNRARPLNDGLCLEVMHFDSVDREFVMSGDGVQYHYTRWTIAATCYVNPERNGVSLYQGSGFASIVESDYTLRNFLRTNRRRLTILFDSALEATADATQAYQVLLDCPQAGQPTDHEEGPTVHSLDVKQCMGSSGYVVRIVVSCATDDAANRFGNNQGVAPLLLSNRWTMTHATDDNGYLVRTISGTAVGNAPELRRKGMVVDQLSSMIFPPLYPGMRRQIPQKEASSEGSTLIYTIVDTQEPMTYLDTPLDPPPQIQAAVEKAYKQDAFSGVYFEGKDDALALKQYLESVMPEGSQATVNPPYAVEGDQSRLWFGQGRRHVARLTVRHTMGLLRDASLASVVETVADSASATLSQLGEMSQNYRESVQENQRRKPARQVPGKQLKSNFKTRRGMALANGLASGGMKTAKALDNLVAKFTETVQVEAVCRPEGNLKRAFFLALSTAYGLANNTRAFVVDPYQLLCEVDYSSKAVSVTVTYNAPDYTTMDRRKSGSLKIMIGPQSYLLGGPLDANIMSDVQKYDGTPLATLVGGLAAAWRGAVDGLESSLPNIFPPDANAASILNEIAKNDLPDKGKLVMMDQSQYGQSFPSFGPNGDQVSRTFMECFVPLFAAPLVAIGEYPVMLGRPTYPQKANQGRSTDLKSFYQRQKALLGDSNAQMLAAAENIPSVTWTNRSF